MKHDQGHRVTRRPKPVRHRRRFTVGPLVTCVLLCGSLCAHAETELELSYDVAFRGVPDRQLLKALKAASDAVSLRAQGPVALLRLRKRAARDTEQFTRVLRAHGYYAAHVAWDINAEADPVELVFDITPGPPYLIRSVIIRAPDGTPAGPADPREIGLVTGQPANASVIVASEGKLLRWFARQGHPFPKVVEQNVVVDHAAQSVEIAYVVEPGPVARFGRLVISGLKTVDETVVRNRIPWKENDPFNGDLLSRAETRLTASMLFGIVQVRAGQALDEQGRVPIEVKLTERRHRTVSIGLGYRTDEGPGLKVSWEHRNLFRHAERLNVSLLVSGIAKAVEGEFRKPHFRRPDRSLILGLRVAEDSPDAYTSRSVTASGAIRRDLTDRMFVSGGLAYKYARVEQTGEKETSSLLSVPWLFGWDTSDDLLDPSRGGRLDVRAAPYFDLRATDFAFVKGRIQYARYVPVGGGRLVLAGRIALGAITGAPRDEVPADERFYAGGGGSIRGYEYQTVSPLEGNDPVGGKSVFEFSAEARIKLSRAVGLVPFVDAGNAFEDSSPDAFGRLFWGAGIGLRYATPIGPLRFDVGFPLDRREGLDEPFQIYISLGNSF